MSLIIHPFTLGPLENNCFLIADDETKQAVIVDPSFASHVLVEAANKAGYDLQAIWITHGHFDHFSGVSKVQSLVPTPLKVGLHSADLSLWREGGGAQAFGFFLEPLPDPDFNFIDGQQLQLGNNVLWVHHTPGHSPGHVIFYSQEAKTAFTGDLIFFEGIGRTDLPGGDYDTLMQSIEDQILTLPEETILLSGHGSVTTVAHEKSNNPFLQ